VRLSWEANNVKPEKDFIVYYTLSDKEFGLSFLTYREKGEDGYFLALLSPKQEIEKKDILPKDIVFVLDTSGSMSGEKIEQAKDALTFCVNSLNTDDKFNIISFATGVRMFKDEMVEANKDNVEKARSWISEITARGGTNISEALLEALKLKGGQGRTFMVIFMTDGLPTIGETDPQNILKSVKKANERECRLFVFGVGHDVNTILLDKLAEENRGARDYIAPEEDIEIRISSFYDKVANPVLADVKLKVEGLEVYDVYPKELPDIFKGSQIAVVGRYKGEGHKAVRLTGKVGEKEKEFIYETTFPEKCEDANYIPRVWATSKVGYLLDEMRLHGENKEVKEEVVRLAKKFGILTPYTSYLVIEDDRNRVAQAPGLRPEEPMGELRRRLRDGDDAIERLAESEKAESGRGAVAGSTKAKELKDAAKAPARPQSGEGMFGADEKNEEVERIGKSIEEVVRRVGPKTFYLNEGFWMDSEYTKDMEEVKVKYMSDEYFELLKKYPAAAKYFAVADRMVVVLDGMAYRIVE
jgi:Ca-activated chloride channel family protein